MLDGKGAINFKSNKGLGIAHGGGGDAGQGQESDSSESDDENAVETNGPKEDWYGIMFQNLTVCN